MKLLRKLKHTMYATAGFFLGVFFFVLFGMIQSTSFFTAYAWPVLIVLGIVIIVLFAIGILTHDDIKRRARG